jgi:hypothetical protein
MTPASPKTAPERHRPWPVPTRGRLALFCALAGLLTACGVAVREVATLGEQCHADEECEPGTFCHEAGVCVQGCERDDQCAEGERCSASRCILDTTDVCDPECGDGERCVQGQCVPECEQMVDCPTSFTCVSGRCEPAECAEDVDCAGRAICQEGLCRSVACLENADCADDSICADHECMVVPPCLLDEHCEAGQLCIAGQCVGQAWRGLAVVAATDAPAACVINADCEWKQYCVGGACAYAAECTRHAHCPAGEPCFDNLCWPSDIY